MKRFLKIIGIALLLSLCVTVFVAVAFAEGEGEEPVDRFAAMGYEFHEEDDTVPKYKVVCPDGTEIVRYESKYLRWDCNGSTQNDVVIDPIPDGSTVVLLSDIYFPNNEEAAGGTGTMFRSENGRTLNFDFAGHTIINEYKGTAFISSGVDSVLNVYSSVPGASIIAVTTASSGCMLLNAGSSGTLNIGDFGEYSGENLTLYTAGLAVTGAYGTINIRNCDNYRMANDHTAYIATRGVDSTINIIDSGIYGVIRDVQLATTNKGSVTTGAKINIENCMVANIGDAGATPGNFLRWMRDGTEINFKNTTFDHIQFTMDTFYSKDAADTTTPDAVVNVYSDCAFYVLPNPDRAHPVVKFPDLALATGSALPKYIFVNRVAENIKYPTYIAPSGAADPSDYTIKDHTNRVAGIYTFTDKEYEQTSTEISWEFNGKCTSEWWRLGETPYPYSFRVPGDTEYIQYSVLDPTPVEEYGFYVVAPTVNIKFYYNLELSSTLNVNVYIPILESENASEVVSRIIAGGEVATTDVIAEAETVELDNGTFYKIAIPIDYSRVSDKLTISLNVMDTVTISARISMVEVVNGLLDGDGTDDFKAYVKGFLYTVKEYSERASIQPPEGLMAIIKERYPENFVTSEEE